MSSLWGMPAWSRFRNQELSCLPPAPFIARQQHGLWQLKAIQQAPLRRRFLPGNLAAVQSIQEGLAALGGEGARPARGSPTLVWDSPVLNLGDGKRWLWEQTSRLGRSPTAAAAAFMAVQGDPAGTQDPAGSANGESVRKRPRGHPNYGSAGAEAQASPIRPLLPLLAERDANGIM